MHCSEAVEPAKYRTKGVATGLQQGDRFGMCTHKIVRSPEVSVAREQREGRDEGADSGIRTSGSLRSRQLQQQQNFSLSSLPCHWCPPSVATARQCIHIKSNKTAQRLLPLYHSPCPLCLVPPLSLSPTFLYPKCDPSSPSSPPLPLLPPSSLPSRLLMAP